MIYPTQEIKLIEDITFQTIQKRCKQREYESYLYMLGIEQVKM